jgi:hypothetical protein
MSYYNDEINVLIKSLEADFTVTSVSPSQTKNMDHYHARRRKEKKKRREGFQKHCYRVQDKAKNICRDKYYPESGVGPIDSRQGVQLTSREITSVGERPLYTGDHDLSDATIKELPWDLSRIVERPSLVASIQWTSTSPRILYSGNVPGDLLTVKLVQIPFNTFQYWNGDVILRLQVAGSPIVQGIVAMSFIPLTPKVIAQNISWDTTSLSINPTVYLYANTNTHAELRIPYNHVQSYLSTDFSNPATVTGVLGTVVIFVLEPLIAIGNVTSITVSLFSIIENSKFKVPRISSQITPAFHAEAGFLTSALSSVSQIGQSLIDPLVADLGGQAKAMMSRVSTMTPDQLISQVAGKALPSNFIGDALDSVGGLLEGAMGFLGLDNPTLPTEHGRCVVKSNGSMNYAIGPEFIEKMSILPSALSLVTPETFATVTDEMDTEYLYRKYSYAGRFDVLNTQNAGSVVYSIPMSPFPTLGNNAGSSLVSVNSIMQQTVYFPLLSYLGLPYRFWTGGLKFKFIVSGSSLHTCRLFVAFNYGLYASPTTLLDASSQYGIALEISQGSNEFEFAIPYVALQPYLEVSTGRSEPNNSMGLMNVVVLNPLIAPTTVAPKISIAVFIAGADDFSYEWLAGVNPAYAIDLPIIPIDDTLPLNEAHNTLADCCTNQYNQQPMYFAESGLLSTQTVAPLNIAPTITDIAVGEDGDEDIQVAPPQTELQVDDHFGITSISLRNLAKKYQFIGSYNISAPIENTKVGTFSLSSRDIFHIPRYGTTAKLPLTDGRGLFSWMVGMYRQFKGSVRLKVVFTALEPTGTGVSLFTNASVYMTPQIGSLNADSPEALVYDDYTMAPASSLSDMIKHTNYTPRLAIVNGVVSNIMEFEVPYCSPYSSVLTNYNEASGDTSRYYDWFKLTFFVASPIAMSASVYAALGDEARFGTLYRVPGVWVPATYNGTTPIHNAGYGRYKVPTLAKREDSWDTEFHAEAGFTGSLSQRFGKLHDANVDEDKGSEERMAVETVVSKSVPDRIASEPMNKMTGTGRYRKPISWVSFFRRKVRGFVYNQCANHARRNELATYMASISGVRKPVGNQLSRYIRLCGLATNKNDELVVPYFRKKRTNRRPLKASPQTGNADADWNPVIPEEWVPNV